MDDFEPVVVMEEETKTESVAVPRRLVDEVTENPKKFGLPEGLSKRKALGRLLVLGARAGTFSCRELERERLYAQLRKDPEAQEAAKVAYAEARDDGLY